MDNRIMPLEEEKVTVKYTDDKPCSCKYCYWYNEEEQACIRKKCYYIVKKKKQKLSTCDKCPYKPTGSKCVGYCMEKVIREMRDKKKKYN